MVLDQEQFCTSREYLAMSGDIFVYHKWDVLSGISWVETREAVKYPIMHKMAFTTKEYPAPNVNSARVEKLWLTLNQSTQCQLRVRF